MPRGVTPCHTARSLAMLSGGEWCHPQPLPPLILDDVGMTRVSVVTYMQWKEIAPQQEYSYQLMTDHLVSHTVYMEVCSQFMPPPVGLVQPYLILQVSIPLEARFTLELRLAHTWVTPLISTPEMTCPSACRTAGEGGGGYSSLPL